MNQNQKEIDELINLGVAGMRDQIISPQQVEEAASRVFQNLQSEYEKLLSGDELMVTETSER